jgi:pimeloyl-ACP methyl ester carboxylesterase
MDGHRHSLTSADGTEIGLLTAGHVPPLLLVHGGMGCIESWQPRALGTVDLKALATEVEAEVLLLLGSASPAWAQDITKELTAVLAHKTLAVLDGQGHDAINQAPELLMTQLTAFFS